MIFAITASGYHSRRALDATDGAEVRVSKVAQMIGECDWGIYAHYPPRNPTAALLGF